MVPGHLPTRNASSGWRDGEDINVERPQNLFGHAPQKGFGDSRTAMGPNHQDVRLQPLHGAGNHLEWRSFLDHHRLLVLRHRVRIEKRGHLVSGSQTFGGYVLVEAVSAETSIRQLPLC